MSFISNSLIAFSMSTDAFAAAIGKGVAMRKPRLAEAMRIGAIFGVVETITPVLGWLAGLAASSFISEVDHWIAFTILGLVGGNAVGMVVFLPVRVSRRRRLLDVAEHGTPEGSQR